MESVFDALDQSSKIRVFLAAKGITQAELATVMGCTAETITNRMRSGKWDTATIKRVADHYQVPLTDLI